MDKVEGQKLRLMRSRYMYDEITNMEKRKTFLLGILRSLIGKQHLQRKFKYTQKVLIPKFSEFMYKYQYFLEVLMNLIGF